MMAKRWQEWVMLIVGAWFVIAPWALGFADQVSTAVLYSAVIVGIAIVGVSIGELVKPKMWEPVLMMVIGLWAIVSPWALGYAAVTAAMANALIAGTIVIALAVWDGIAHFDLAKRVRGGGTGHAT